jgi:hypothetical protein
MLFYSTFFPFSLLGKAKHWFYANNADVLTDDVRLWSLMTTFWSQSFICDDFVTILSSSCRYNNHSPLIYLVTYLGSCLAYLA